MKCENLQLHDAKIIFSDVHLDQRGIFSRTYCLNEYKRLGIPTHWPQGNLSTNRYSGTLRGIHFQKHPHGEAKLIQCCSGSMFDVIVDLRKTSPTYLQHEGIELTEGDGKSVYIPSGFGHGFITVEDNTSVLYMMGREFNPESSSGIRWNDKALQIQWPITPKHVSTKDQNWPDWII